MKAREWRFRTYPAPQEFVAELRIKWSVRDTDDTDVPFSKVRNTSLELKRADIIYDTYAYWVYILRNYSQVLYGEIF